ncbi:MAG: PAS domain-containing protein [Blastococcus sp.]
MTDARADTAPPPPPPAGRRALPGRSGSARPGHVFRCSRTPRLHPDDRPRTLETMDAAVADCEEFDAEFRVVLPSGETRWLRAHGRVLADDTGSAVRSLGAGFDTTRQ